MSTIMRHAIYWTVIFILWLYMKSFGNPEPVDILLNIINVSIFMMVFYLLRTVQIPYLYNQDKTVQFVLSVFASGLFFLLIWKGAMELADHLLGEKFNLYPFTFGAYILEAVQFHAPGIALLAWESHHDRQEELDRIHLLEKEKIESELNYLKTQINPKFLFNTLNHLHTSVINKSPDAPDMIMQLSGILDYVLYRSQKEQIPLQEEIESIDHFIALEKTRFGNRLKLSYKRPDESKIQISPLVLLSLFENLFQYLDELTIQLLNLDINIYTQNNQVVCKLILPREANIKFVDTEEFSDIKYQLELVYPNQHELITKNDELLLTINALR